MHTRVLAGVALLTNALLPISFFWMAAAQRSGGGEGMWAVMLFYPLVLVAPILSRTTMALNAMAATEKPGLTPRILR
jgi:hypothetical protein